MVKLQIEHVSKTLEGLHTLNDICLKLKEKEFVVILGPSGCGKSTLLNIIAGLITPDQGRVLIDGEDWSGRTARVSYMQQKDLLLPWKNILDNVSVPLLLKGIKKKEARQKAQQFLADFGLKQFATYYPRQLSGGMRQRAALLRTYLFASDILLLDEPFAALDAITRQHMQLWLQDLRAHLKPSIVFVTHDINEAIHMADRIYILSARPAHVKLVVDLTKVSGETERLKLQKRIFNLLAQEVIPC
ncbi:MAG: ABC transporter ATP-binding protein [Syntrophomonadaceae bacterium]|jgi:ABC-type nitrate/sulfonate/bicarbonate transport system ATPase subunit